MVMTRRRTALLLLLLLAAAARFPTLAWRSLDGDEGATLYFISFSYRDLVAHLADLTIERHPLLYYIPLKAWTALAGDSDLALRLPSALAGMLTVALIYQAGRRRLGELAAFLAATLAAFNPLVVYQHQDARNYALPLFCSALAVWALWEALERPEARAGWRLVVFFVALTAAAYSHLIAATIYPALGVMLLVEAGERGRMPRLPAPRAPQRHHVARWGLVALAASAALYLPYPLNILRAGMGRGGGIAPEAWARTALGAAGALAGWRSPLDYAVDDRLMLGALAALLALGAWRGRRMGALLAFWFVSSLAITVWVTLGIGFFQSKTLVFCALPMMWLVGLACFGRSSGAVAAASCRAEGIGSILGALSRLLAVALVGLTLWALTYQWRPSHQREDFRHAAAYVRARATPHDRVVMHLTWYRYVFGHYYAGPFAHPFANNVDAQTPIEEGLRPYLDGQVLWLVQAGVGLPGSAGDPERVVQRWLAERYPVVTEVFPNGVDVRGYATRYRSATLPETATPLEVAYPNGLTLVGYELPQRELPTRDVWLHPPSTWVPVTLYWTTARPLDDGVRIALALEDERNAIWGLELPRERDVRAFYPPSRWQPGEVVRWDFDINVNPRVPPGEYKVVLRVRSTEGGAALRHAGGEDWLILGRVRLRP